MNFDMVKLLVNYVVLGYATVPRGYLSLPMLSRCTDLGIARAAPPCTSGSADDRRRTRVIAMLRQGVHALKFSADVRHQVPSVIYRRAVGEHSAMYIRTKNVPDTSATHRQHIGDARVDIGDAYSM